jgi:eukaryotic-like serine/threonine-protein kinase
MTSERWQQVNELFQLAADRAPEERTTFLQTACQGDEGLLREVESLIASYERAENFIESPAFEVVPELLTADRTSAIIGESIGHYQIETLLGVGGMGEVYLARDERLGRKVALKFLPERLTANNTQLSRFKSEARAASALNHPNILTVYEIGTEGNRHFIATEFIEGVTLRAALARGKMNVHDALDVAVQVASALAAAHAAGVVHRDIKPENIMIRPDGFVKVLDFGLAKLTEQNPASNSQDIKLTNTQHTLAGLLVGTPRYMSPEQARGQAADARSDIWSLGVVIYEMVGGVPPFTGATPTDCLASILKTEAAPLSRVAPAAPAELQAILHKALRKNKDDRYQTNAEMLTDLRSVKRKLERAASAPKIEPAWPWIAAATAIVLIGIGAWFFTYYHSLPLGVQTPSSSSTGTTAVTASANIPEKSIAVLPFENRSRDPDNAYFADAIQDEILTRLSKIADLKVISRTSTQHYKSTPANVPEIAKQLGVAHILEGSVQKSGDAVRVNVQLIKAANDAHIWADTLDRKLTDILSVESEVAKAIADKLRAKLTGEEEQLISAKPTDNPEAYDAYLRGLAYSLKTANSTANVVNAQKYLREAVRLDPKFALAWALLSFVESRGYGTVTLQPTDALREEARQAAETALSLQPNLGEAMLAKGFYHYACLRDYDTAVRYFEQARQFLPNSSRIPESLAYVTRRQGQWDRSELYFNEAERLDPRNVSLLTQHALSYKDRRRFPEALRKLEQILNITPDDIDTIVEKGAIAQAEGDLPRAATLLASVQPAADDTNALETQAYQAILERRPGPIIAQLKVLLANPDAALGFYKGGLRFWLGWAQEVTGNSVAAKESWQQARRELEPFLTEQPENHILLGDLALTAMSLGDKTAAFDFSERAMAALPVEKDAVRGPAPIEILARVAAKLGEADRAIEALQRLLSIPYSGPLGPGAPLTPALLRLDPMFDPLRNDARFKKMVEEGKGPVAATVPAKSIAVLPFENLSRDPDNAYFAEGIQDEILTRLSKIADLKVISRTSTRQYKSASANVPEIAKQLGVAHVLEGSVQKSGDAVRVNVQLIRAADDSHIWADTFDRKLTDTFSVESEVAKAIADQLGAKLTGQEEQVLAAKPTDNPDAYDAYLRGLAYSLKPANNTANSLGAQKYLREAVRLDPKFARAWALLSSVNSLGYLTKTLQPTAALREEARQAVETALSLEPNLGEALLAKGYYHYGCLKDYDTAIRYFEQARQLLPNDSRIAESLAYVTRRRGQWEQSETYFKEAERLDPRNANLLTQHAVSLMRLRRLPEAFRKLDQVLNITPDDVRTVAFKAGIAQAEGDLARAAALLAPLHPNADDAGTLETQVYQAILERRPAAIIPRLEKILDKPDPELGYFNSDLRFWLGWAQKIAGDHAAAEKSWRQARSELESFLKEQPDNFNVLTDLALTNMGLGDKGAALAFAERAIAANPIEKDAISGPSGIETLARVAAQMGEPDHAIAALQKLLSIPAVTDTAAPFTAALLRLDPMFDPLRKDSRFQELVAPAGTTLSSPAQIPEKSIAVLPFENRSSDPENAFFTDGVQDEILTDLARIADLKVISRTSVMQYKTGPKRNLRQIGNELGVAHVVEGSVQRVGDRVRVNAQLIDARTDAHLWAQTYDRDLADVFAIQSEIAKTIADQLQANLSANEKSAIEQTPTTDITAFDLYAHAKNIFLKAFAGVNARGDLLQAADLLKQAVTRDPSFFQAYCQLAFTYINIYGVLDPNPAYLAEAEAALQSASRLRPDAGETHLARARNFYWGYLDYGGASRELEIARQSLPGEDWVFSLKGYIERRQGRWEECIRDLKRATELDPRNVLTLQQLALTYQQLRRYAEEKSTFERILAFEPNDPITKSQHAFVELDSKADTRPLHEVTDSIRDKNPAALSSIADNWILCALAERDSAAARKALIALGENPASLAPIADVRFNRSFMEGVIARLAKDDAKAQAAFTAARAEQEKIIKAQPNYGPAVCVLGLIDAALGRKQEALREGRRAVDLLPVEKDALRGIAMIKYLAMIAAWVGDKDLACEQLAIAIRNPSDLSYGQLKLMPFWDPLRGDPRFEKLVEEVKQPVALSASTSAVPGRANVTPAPEKSIAVLPFENLSRDPDNAFFTDGVHEEILTGLARIAHLKVISRTSVMQYNSRAKSNLRQIANELGVAHIVEGSVQRASNRVRVNAQLIDARTDTHLWAQTYDRELTDVFAVESDIASTIADTLQATLTGSARTAMASKPTENPEAHQLYLRGRFFWNKRTASDLRKAINLFEEAVAKDPRYAQAYAAIAQSWLLLPGYEDSAPKDCFPKAQTAAEKALALDQSLSDAHTALAAVKVLYNFDPLGSIAEFEQAIKLNPNDATAHHWLGNHPLTAIGDLDRALAEVRRAQELDPLSLVINTNIGWGLLMKGRYDEAVAQLRKTIEMDGTFYYARYILGQALQLSGQIAEAEKEYKKATELATDPVPLAYLAHLCGTNGRKEEARKIVSQLLEMRKQHYVDAYCLGIAYLGLGDRAEAMNWLEQGYRDRNGYELASVRVDPFLATLRGDPRFEALAEKIVPARDFKRRVASK